MGWGTEGGGGGCMTVSVRGQVDNMVLSNSHAALFVFQTIVLILLFRTI